MSFVWTPTLSVGIDSIDAQHEELFRRVSALMVVAGRTREEGEVLRTLAFLGEYIVTHFGEEELLMREAGYPGLAVQVVQHARFTETFGRLRARFARHGLDAAFAAEVRSEVCDWLVQHIEGSDRAMGEWLAGRGLGRRPLVRATAPKG